MLKKRTIIYVIVVVIGVIILGALALFGFIFGLRGLIAEPFYVKGGSMSPNFAANDYIILNKMDSSYNRGDVIVYRLPRNESQFLISRIIGLPGEKISIINDKVSVNGSLLDESGYLNSEIETKPFNNGSDFILKADEYFVMGDNRGESLDSRRFGPLTNNLIIGKYWFTATKANQ